MSPREQELLTLIITKQQEIETGDNSDGNIELEACEAIIFLAKHAGQCRSNCSQLLVFWNSNTLPKVPSSGTSVVQKGKKKCKRGSAGKKHRAHESVYICHHPRPAAPHFPNLHSHLGEPILHLPSSNHEIQTFCFDFPTGSSPCWTSRLPPKRPPGCCLALAVHYMTYE